MKIRLAVLLISASALSALLFLSNMSYSRQKDKRVTILYTHGIDGCLEPCG
ncbi:MAG: hypothetical protein PVG99_09700 [Desulfobacteraceae bacterium]